MTERERSKHLVEVPKDRWPTSIVDPARTRVLRSRRFLVQEFNDSDPKIKCRLTICRTTHNGKSWDEGITWDELQQIKDECGYGVFDAVEIYPRTVDIVRMANMRHLWVLNEEISFKWK